MHSKTLEAARLSLRGGGWAPSGWASLWEYRAAQSRQARSEEPQEPSWATAEVGTLTLLPCRVAAQRRSIPTSWHHGGRPLGVPIVSIE